ncbi:MAG: DUF3500 domain-containing protein [Myxococcota bacterium]
MMARTWGAVVVLALTAASGAGCGSEDGVATTEGGETTGVTTSGSGMPAGSGGDGAGGADGTGGSDGTGGTGGDGKATVCLDMVDEALAFLDALDADGFEAATADFGSGDHTAFEFLPPNSAPRAGVSWKDLDMAQRERLTTFLQSAFSAPGYAKLEQIRALESVLAMQESGVPSTPNRDPENYFIQFFGTPVADGDLPWGFRFEGHHLSVQAAVIDCTLFSATPAFWGASPEITPLSTEVTTAENLFAGLDAGLQTMAEAGSVGPNAVNVRDGKLDPLSAEGLRYGDMPASAQTELIALVDLYLDNMNGAIAADRRAAIVAAGLDDISFLYDGGNFRVLGPTFVIELIYAGGDHIHSVWRDYDGDYGDDLIARHLAADHR